ncbi:MAG: hypothetical protein ACKVS6_01360 [Planctomycetota bacterium]
MIPKYTILAVALLAGAVGASRFHAVPVDDINYETMSKDVETMRRVLDKELRNAKAGSRKSADVLYFDGAGSDAYYVGGGGFVYIGSVDAVFVASPKKDEPEKEAKEHTLWEEVQAEMDGRVTLGSGSSRGMVYRNAKYDPKVADDYQERAIRTMGKYASKIGQLKDSDKITIILRGSSARVLTTTVRANNSDDNNKDKEMKEDMPELAANLFASSVYAVNAGAVGTVMTLSASVEDCAAFAAGKTDFDAFASKVKVSRYANTAAKSGYSYSFFGGAR